VGYRTRRGACCRHTPKPKHKVLRSYEKYNKLHNSLLIQLHTENICLRDFLYQKGFPGITDPHCVCREGRQTVMHILMGCTKDAVKSSWNTAPGRCKVTVTRAPLAEMPFQALPPRRRCCSASNVVPDR
jgi:hypothetical protein